MKNSKTIHNGKPFLFIFILNNAEILAKHPFINKAGISLNIAMGVPADRLTEEIFRLSDAFEKAEEHPEPEVICRVININPGKNDAFLSRCRVLDEYTQFMEKVNENRKMGWSARMP